MKIISLKQLPDNFFYFPIIGLALCLILKIIQIGIGLYKFPFTSIGDLENRVLYLFFLKDYGFHQLVADKYHHIILFKDYPPAWYYFTFPFYVSTGNLFIAVFLSLLAIFILGFLFIYFLNKNITPIKRIAFFLFFFANLQMIDYLQIGRHPEILGWVVFIPLWHYTNLYKNKKIDLKYSLITIFLFSILILTHVYVAVISFTIIFSLFIIKNYKEKMIIALITLGSFILTSFWWIPFLEFVKEHKGAVSINELLNSSSIISYNTLFILGFFLMTFLYIQQVKNKYKHILFLLPSLILGLLIITRLIVLIPPFNTLPITPYNVYFSFLAIYLFFQIDFKTEKIKRIICLGLILLTLSSLVIFYLRVTPFIPLQEELDIEIMSFFPIIQDNFFIFNPRDSRTVEARYAKLEYNLSSPNSLHYYINEGVELSKTFREKDCNKLNILVKQLDLKNLISYNGGCDILKECGFNEKLHKERVCLYY